MSKQEPCADLCDLCSHPICSHNAGGKCEFGHIWLINQSEPIPCPCYNPHVFDIYKD